MAPMSRLAWLLVSVATLLSGGCSRAPAPEFIDIPADNYAEAFQATKDVLRAWGFELDRVDARLGVVTTHPRASAGLATPWIPHSRGLADSTAGLLHHERRIARATFAPRKDEGPPEVLDPASPLDLRTIDTPLVLMMSVEVQRLYRPGQRLAPASIRLTSETDLPGLQAQPDSREQVTITSRPDPELAARLLRACAARIP